MKQGEQIRDVLFTAGSQWGHRSPDEIVSALNTAGYEVLPQDVLAAANELIEIFKSDTWPNLPYPFWGPLVRLSKALQPDAS